MKVLHILASGGFGGIETLLNKYSLLSEMDNVFVFVWGGGAIYESMKAQNIPCININEKQGKFFHSVKEIVDVCKRENPDVIITHHSAPQFKIVIAWMSLIHPNIKTIAYAHANGNDIAVNGNKIKSFINKKINEIGFKRADKIIAISESVKESVVEVFGVSAGKVSVVYNGTDISTFNSVLQEKLHIPTSIVYIGRLIKEKGVQVTLRVLAMLPKTFKWTFDIVGDGPYRHILEKQVEDSGINENVHFYGSRSDIPDILKSHDIFIHMPEWEEGFGITVIEAMAAGLVCICANKGGIPEIIENGRDGFLVNSEKELNDILKKIMKNPDQMNLYSIKENAIRKASKFSIECYAKHLDAEVADVLEKGKIK